MRTQCGGALKWEFFAWEFFALQQRWRDTFTKELPSRRLAVCRADRLLSLTSEQFQTVATGV
jgi:hypothetical protein